MNGFTAVRLVAGREISTRIRSKALIWTTIIMLAAIVGGSLVVSLLQGREPEPTSIGVSDRSPELLAAVESAAATTGVEVEASAVDEAAGEQAVRDGDLDVLLRGSGDDLTVVVDEQLDPTLAPTMAILAQQLALDDAITQLGGDPAEVNQAVLGAEPTIEALNPPETEVNAAAGITGLIAGILIFIAIMTTGQMVAQGVVEEKSSRVVELLLSTIRPWQLIAGKVLGIGLLGIGQVVLYVAAGAGSAIAFGLLDGTDVQIGSAAVWLIVWFLLGYAMYAVLLGALASLVSRQEDVGNVIAPVTMMLMVPYLLAVTIAPWQPDNTLVVVVSLIPFFSPILMPVRIALGAAEVWEIALTVGLSVVLIVVLTWLAGKIYSRAVMRTGARVSIKEVLRG